MRYTAKVGVDGVKGGRPLAADVPDNVAQLFETAQRYVEGYFAERRDDPTRGIIEIAGERYILVRAAAMSTEFFELVVDLYRERGEEEARAVASGFLFDIAHALGKSDARSFHTKMNVTDPMERLSAGPIHFAFTGWAKVAILPTSHPSPDDDFLLIYEHPSSFEADSWLRSGKRAAIPICFMNSGYSSGWCQESFDTNLVSVEISCRAAGDAACRFIMAPPSRIHEYLGTYAPNRSEASHGASLEVPEFFKRKRLEEELHRYRDRLEELVAERSSELLRANQQLRQEIAERKLIESQLLHAQKMEAIGTLAGGLAHDFNNLLTTVMASVQLAIRHSKSDERTVEWLRDAQNATERAADLTKQMLYLSRREEQAFGPVDMVSLISRTCRFLRQTLPMPIRVEEHVPDDPIVVEGDLAQLEQTILNLAINARDAMKDGGVLSIRAERVIVAPDAAAAIPEARAGEFARLSVGDTGTGIPPEVAKRIFEPFFTTKAPGSGTGLGLAMVYGCATAHQGWVTLDSEDEHGCVFHIYLPLSADSVPSKADDQDHMPCGDEHVMLVDDAGAVRYAGQSILESCGYDVVTACDGREALAKAAEIGPRLAMIITDLVMPRASGRDLLRGLRDAGSRVPVILTSGHAVDREVSDLIEEGFAAFIQKPFDAHTLARIVRQVLDAG